MIFTRYHRRNPFAIAQLALNDILFWVYAKTIRPKQKIPRQLNRILLVNPAHLGDVVISMALIRELKQKYPECRIDFLAGDWSAPILKDHPGIDRSYYISHWQANRSKLAISEKKRQFKSHVKKVMPQLKENAYDAIFFLNSYEPSFIPLFKSFNCPLIGYVSAGGGPLLINEASSQKEPTFHEVQLQAGLFIPWLGAVKKVADYQPWLRNVNGNEQITFGLDLNETYVVIHPGSGNPAKEWSLDSWVQVIDALDQYSINVLITGHGEREANQASVLINRINNPEKVKNLVGHLSFDDFCKLISKAKAVFCVDSLAGHIAGSYVRPTIVVTNGLSKIERWHPLGKSVRLLENKVTCSPCHSNPCAQRACVNGISPQMLIHQLQVVFEV
ncbi:glycosyltransferase family 9 protein [Polynucleobacter sp. MWH-HuK1]|uniref:glycosyltransferase family 9 protein n=1 Tax=Polynucleobacter sp. MWH-HuK1 TaxID=1743158 RepID=UPI001C0B725D|nr:glycosyltransferase family 9 protein [Polynucleobacter sp. MWH-HuK1]MBU3564471.1 glycosyltransferase family 9 protein [Polynucleobacter sp. MWH-HuK1]